MVKSIWKAESDSALLLEIIMTGDLKSLKWPAVSAALYKKGFSFTAEACRQHFQKLRKDYLGPNASPAKRTKSNPGTPSKKPKPTKSFVDLSNDTGNGNGNAESSSFAHDDDDEEFGVSPSPLKRKREVKEEEEGQSAPRFKMEYADAGRAVDLEQNE
ncbi:hypothetical protein LAWI1_G008397 [Lachnellula willkommii]|uniref:Myb-like domain-containing protein n=1 Tax=Lachnellula willkommii TaxID=215461 RepID=A0A559M5T8_9HELO|nr:hypothetical protein LAWI1_G008397 [Lachnellula willkommii]